MDYYANRVLLLCYDWLDRDSSVACDWTPLKCSGTHNRHTSLYMLMGKITEHDLPPFNQAQWNNFYSFISLFAVCAIKIVMSYLSKN